MIRPAPEESYITWANLEARVQENNQTVDVRIEYQIRKNPGTRSLSYEGLETFDTRFDQVQATFGNQSIHLEPSKESIKIIGSIDLPEEQVRDSSITFVITYRIQHAILQDRKKFDINIPILWIEQARSRSDKHLFQAHLALPKQYYVKETFPALSSECLDKTDPSYTCISLQVLPTFLRVRGLVGHNPILTPLQVLEFIIISLLIATSAIVLRSLVRRKKLNKQPV